MAKGILKNDRFEFECPGCGEKHSVTVNSKTSGANWQFNGDLDSPTLKPSVLVRVGHYVKGQPQPPNCVNCNSQESDDPWPWPCSQCHSFVENGNIRFLNDCTHELAGQTVPLPEVAYGE